MPKTLPKLTLSPRLGSTHETALRISSQTMRYSPISGMAQSAPLEIFSTAHGILDGWKVAIIGAKGMVELNASDPNDIKVSEYHRCTVIDADTVDFDGISAANFRTYTSGGYLAFYAPMSLASYTSARMDIKTRVGGEVILALNTTGGTLEIDAATSTVWIRLDDTSLDSVAARRDYVFDIELVSASAVDAICSADSVLEVLPEVTTSV